MDFQVNRKNREALLVTALGTALQAAGTTARYPADQRLGRAEEWRVCETAIVREDGKITVFLLD
ncbi:hypothetical protein, partial [Streptomyces sp. CYG21]|uniref:hypothetical protein n=1 Tax=Streptomyces sp. CYG21 TaxID=2838874 RepID=UPI001C27D98B